MSLERRLTEALHQTDDYQPSVDLFARLSRSIEEDRAHRRRLGRGIVAVLVGFALLASFLVAQADRDPAGVLVVPKWSTQVVMAVVLISCLLAFGPAIRRLGQPYLADVFHMQPTTGERFAALLDIAYYLFFAGGILSNLDLTEAGSFVPAATSLEAVMEEVAYFLTILGAAHVGNLLVLPMVGLLFSSLSRRARRGTAGTRGPPASERAWKTDRLVMAIVVVAVLLGLGGGLVVIALLVMGL
jgi:hypothetical protein